MFQNRNFFKDTRLNYTNTKIQMLPFSALRRVGTSQSLQNIQNSCNIRHITGSFPISTVAVRTRKMPRSLLLDIIIIFVIGPLLCWAEYDGGVSSSRESHKRSLNN